MASLRYSGEHVSASVARESRTGDIVKETSRKGLTDRLAYGRMIEVRTSKLDH